MLRGVSEYFDITPTWGGARLEAIGLRLCVGRGNREQGTGNREQKDFHSASTERHFHFGAGWLASIVQNPALVFDVQVL